MGKKPKLTPDQMRELIEIIHNELPEKKFERGEFYMKLAKQFNVGKGVIIALKHDNDGKTAESYRRYSMKKEVTDEMATTIITELYNELYGKKPDYIKCFNQYGVMQVVIKQPLTIMQFDEYLLIHKIQFIAAADKSLRFDKFNKQKNLK